VPIHLLSSSQSPLFHPSNPLLLLLRLYLLFLSFQLSLLPSFPSVNPSSLQALDTFVRHTAPQTFLQQTRLALRLFLFLLTRATLVVTLSPTRSFIDSVLYKNNPRRAYHTITLPKHLLSEVPQAKTLAPSSSIPHDQHGFQHPIPRASSHCHLGSSSTAPSLACPWHRYWRSRCSYRRCILHQWHSSDERHGLRRLCN
jgi:hypothetical protein